MRSRRNTYPIRTDWGLFNVQICKDKISSLSFPARSRKRRLNVVFETSEIQRVIKELEKALRCYVEGKSDVKVSNRILERDLSESQLRMMRALKKIRMGETRDYAWLARECGFEGGYQAAGQLLGSNPLPVVFPCHRIVKKNGALGGFSGGVKWKMRLLRHEGIRFTKEGKVAGKVAG